MLVQLLISRPVVAHNWLLALRAMIGANYWSITVSSHGSLYCEWLCYTLVVGLLTKCIMWQLWLLYDMSTIHYRKWDCAERHIAFKSNELSVQDFYSKVVNQTFPLRRHLRKPLGTCYIVAFPAQQ